MRKLQLPAPSKQASPRQVCQDFVRVVEDLDFEKGLHFSMGSSLHAATDYQITGDAARDRMFVAVVLQVGPGKPQAPDECLWLRELHEAKLITTKAFARAAAQFSKHTDIPPVVAGDIIVCNLNSVSYRVPSTKGHYLIRANVIMATIDRASYRVGPLQHYILMRSNDKRTRQAISRGGLWMPTADLATDDRPHRKRSGIVASYGEVLACGTGAWIDGVWHQPTCQVGDLVLYDASFATLPITVRGERFDLVASTQVVDIVQERPKGWRAPAGPRLAPAAPSSPLLT